MPNDQPRMAAFDGLRGIACLLVVLLHIWVIVPPAEYEERLGPLLGLVKSGNLGVTIFFVLGGFLVTRGLLDALDQDRFDVSRFWMRRLIRVCAPLYLMLLIWYAVSLFDHWDSFSATQTQRSMIGIVTFTFNWTLVDRAVESREDFGQLWYLSVEQQFYFVWVLTLTFLGRCRRALMLLTLSGAIAVFAYRWYVLEHDWSWPAQLRTATRSDGLLLGAFAALVIPHLQNRRHWARRLTLPLLASATVLVLWSPELDQYAFLQTQGIVFAVITTSLVLAIAVGDDADGVSERLLALPVFAVVGRVAYPLYLWHLPVFWASSRWARGIDWMPRAVGSLVVLVVVVWLTYTLIELPILRWLNRLPPARDVRQRQAAVAGD